MKVLLYSHVFAPSVGGVETVSMALAQGFAHSGLECTVLTRTPGADTDACVGAGAGEADAAGSASEGGPPLRVIANPGRAQIRHWLAWADVVLFNGASLALQPWLWLSRKPFVWVHVGYQASCIDGLGWVDGRPAPRTPWASFVFHGRHGGWPHAVRDGIKLALRRFVATRLATRNVAITQWMDRAQPLPRQVQIYNPFPLARFAALAASPRTPDFDFVYLGRIVSEKGVDTLLRAFARVVAQARPAPAPAPRLLLIGDGPWMQPMQELARTLGIAGHTVFAGRQTGAMLAEWVGRGRIAIVPSAWEEPMGGVAVELMAAGLGLIVSARGGLAECAGDAGLSFPNGDDQALAACMLRLLADPALQAALGRRAIERAREFAPERFVAQYVELLRGLK